MANPQIGKLVLLWAFRKLLSSMLMWHPGVFFAVLSAIGVSYRWSNNISRFSENHKSTVSHYIIIICFPATLLIFLIDAIFLFACEFYFIQIAQSTFHSVETRNISLCQIFLICDDIHVVISRQEIKTLARTWIKWYFVRCGWQKRKLKRKLITI